MAAVSSLVFSAGCQSPPSPPSARVEKVPASEEIELSLRENVVDARKVVGTLDPESSTGSLPAAFIVDRYDNLWFVRSEEMTERGRPAGYRLALVSYDTQTGHRRRFVLPEPVRSKSHAGPIDDGRGSIWMGVGDGLLRLDKASEIFTKFPLPTSSAEGAGASVLSIALDGEGRAWLVRSGLPSLTVFDPETSRFAETRLPLGTRYPLRLFANERGEELWVTTGQSQERMFDADGVGRFDVRSSSFRNVRMSAAAIGVESDGDLIYSASDGRLKRLDGKLLISQPLGRQGGIPEIHDLLVGASGNVWLVVPGGLKRIVPGSPIVDFVRFGPRVRPFDLRHGARNKRRPGRYVYGMAEDSAGNLWFSDVQSRKVGVVRMPERTE